MLLHENILANLIEMNGCLRDQLAALSLVSPSITDMDARQKIVDATLEGREIQARSVALLRNLNTQA